MILPETKVYGGRLKNREQLYKSSSGGAFTALTDVFLNKGYAIVCSSYNYSSYQQEFRIIETKEDRDKALGSKYFQSLPGSVFVETKDWLKKHPDKKILFVGMGCQSAGFISLAEAEGFSNQIVVIDIICHGSPSPQIWKDYATLIEKRYGEITLLSFKDKRKGWLTPTSVATVRYGEIRLNSFVRIYNKHVALRPSCHKCPYTTTERKTDITIGDFWHIEEKLPNQFDEDGTSVFIIHTDKGMKLFEEAKDSINWFESDTSECWQHNLEYPTSSSDKRKQFWDD